MYENYINGLDGESVVDPIEYRSVDSIGSVKSISIHSNQEHSNHENISQHSQIYNQNSHNSFANSARRASSDGIVWRKQETYENSRENYPDIVYSANFCFICKLYKIEFLYSPCNCIKSVHSNCLLDMLNEKKYCCVRKHSKYCQDCGVKYRIDWGASKKRELDSKSTFTLKVLLKWSVFILYMFSCVGITYNKNILDYFTFNVHTTYNPNLVCLALITALLFAFMIWFAIYMVLFGHVIHLVISTTLINIMLTHIIVIAVFGYFYRILLWNIQTFTMALFIYAILHLFLTISILIIYCIYKCLRCCTNKINSYN